MGQSRLANGVNARSENRILLALMMILLVVAVLSSADITVTLDEPLHYHYGLFVLDGGTDRIDDSSMPVSALNALPSYIGTFLPNGFLRNLLSRYFLARLVTIIFAVSFTGVVFRWSRALYGVVPAAITTLLYVLDPNIIANSQLVTTDVFAVGMMTLSFYWLWRFANSGRIADGVTCAVVVGLSQLVKYSAVALLPLGLAALLLHDLPGLRQAYGERGLPAIARYAGRVAIYLLVTGVIAVAIINVGFLMNRTFTPLKDYRFRSELFRNFQSRLSLIGMVPVPVPYPYLEGLDWMRETEQTADRYGNIYLLGHVSKPKGFAGYYFVASALKVPVSGQIIILLALGVYALDRQRRGRFLRDEVFLLLPVAAFTLYFDFFFNAQTGLRYYLVVFPLLYVFAGNLFRYWRGLSVWGRASALVLVIYLAVAVLSYFPYFTPYFNELVWDKTQTYKFLSDTNLEWGQSQNDLQRYLADHPDTIYKPTRIEPGRLAVSGSDLVGILEDPGRYAWLRENFEPAETIAYCYFVYVISPQEIEQMCSRPDKCR